MKMVYELQFANQTERNFAFTVVKHAFRLMPDAIGKVPANKIKFVVEELPYEDLKQVLAITDTKFSRAWPDGKPTCLECNSPTDNVCPLCFEALCPDCLKEIEAGDKNDDYGGVIVDGCCLECRDEVSWIEIMVRRSRGEHQ